MVRQSTGNGTWRRGVAWWRGNHSWPVKVRAQGDVATVELNGGPNSRWLETTPAAFLLLISSFCFSFLHLPLGLGAEMGGFEEGHGLMLAVSW
ncbi:hypothetical protein M0R45_030678 [Rubus argutus]|uniref:Uncharacterized protein n=1 Tax=Rubus argutus TaxID=59490 RepID=A0AAW1WG19_RUBAR